MKKSGEIPTAFPKSTVVHYKGIPCELLQETPYYSETIKGKKSNHNSSKLEPISRWRCASCRRLYDDYEIADSCCSIR